MTRLLLIVAPVALLAQSTVPFVGCPLDGQTGPQPAPTGKPQVVQVSVGVASQVAYYSAGGIGVIAPRGWHCFGIYGSSGGSLYVSPQPVPKDLLEGSRAGIPGPGIILSEFEGQGFGRGQVAQPIARAFPARREFTDKARELFEFEVPSGPYPTDKLVHNGDSEVEFSTSAGMDGLGTYSGMKKGERIEGMVILEGAGEFISHLAIRLPRGMEGLTPEIKRQFKYDFEHARRH